MNNGLHEAQVWFRIAGDEVTMSTKRPLKAPETESWIGPYKLAVSLPSEVKDVVARQTVRAYRVKEGVLELDDGPEAG